MSSQNIVEIAQSDPQFSLLVGALDAAGLVNFVANERTTSTVFTPTNDAFAALAVDRGFTGDRNDEDAVFGAIVDALTTMGDGNPLPLLQKVLLTHVPNGEKSAARVDKDPLYITKYGERFGINGTGIVDADPGLTNPNIIVPDVQASNGLMKVIDRVIIPVNITGQRMSRAR